MSGRGGVEGEEEIDSGSESLVSKDHVSDNNELDSDDDDDGSAHGPRGYDSYEDDGCDDDDDHNLSKDDYEDESGGKGGKGKVKKKVTKRKRERNDDRSSGRGNGGGKGDGTKMRTQSRRRVSSGSSASGGGRKSSRSSGSTTSRNAKAVGSVVHTRGQQNGSNADISDISIGSKRYSPDHQSLWVKYQELQKKFNKQAEVIRTQKEKVESLTSIVRYKRKGRGKNKTRNKDNMTPLDDQNRVQINSYIRKQLYPNYKILPPNWSNYSSNTRSFCQHLMRTVTVPTGMTEETYWDTVVRDLVNEKYGALKANYKEAMKKQTIGRVLVFITLFVPSMISYYCSLPPVLQLI